MTLEELKEYLRANLSIQLSEEDSSDYSGLKYLVTKLVLDGEVISDDFITLPPKE